MSLSESAYFKPEYATRYAEFDVDEANKKLDDLGLTARDGEGMRLRKDGSNLTFIQEYALQYRPLPGCVRHDLGAVEGHRHPGHTQGGGS